MVSASHEQAVGEDQCPPYDGLCEAHELLLIRDSDEALTYHCPNGCHYVLDRDGELAFCGLSGKLSQIGGLGDLS